ncbi:MAG: 2Fe-2S iron-sulfur cluster-binding protein [SAR86 cluster bacterium]|nr:2Fe-2S iron-sulfur cluster-binding protein [SAR86 cluster bacterium]
MFSIFKKKDRNFSVELLESDIKFQVSYGENLLATALSRGINWPYKCKVGSCGTCKYQLIKGSIKKELDFSYVLGLEEIEGGISLACQTTLKSDIQIKVALLK